MNPYTFRFPVYFSFLLFFVLPVATQQESCGTKVDCVTLVKPVPGSSEVPLGTELQWTPVPGDGITYRLKIDAGGVEFFNQEGLPMNRFTLPRELPQDADITVSLVAVNARGQESQDCEVWQFKTVDTRELPPPCTQIVSPQNNASGVALRPLIRWGRVDGATGYVLRAGSAPDNGDIIAGDTLGDVTEFGGWPNALGFEQEVHVLVVPLNDGGSPEGCQSIRFTTEAEPILPEAPECTQLALTDPATSVDVPLDTRIGWAGATGLIHGYRVRIVEVASGDVHTDEDIETSEGSFSFKPDVAFRPDQEIRVTITPYNEANGRQDAVNCASFSFTTIGDERPINDCPRITFPTDGATGVSLSDVIRWEAAEGNPSGYRLQAGTADGQFDLFDQRVGNVLFYPAYFLFYDQTIFLRVTPYNASGDAITDCESIRITTGSRPEGAPRHIRRNIAEMPDGHPDLETYKLGVQRLKALDRTDPNNPLSWGQQAFVHGNGNCQHGNLFFLPWHRAYLFYLEEAIREVTGNEDFALPYWDWTAQPEIPGAFWGGSTNPLWHSARTANEQTDRWGETTNARNIERIHDNIAFFGFSNDLERSPHNNVHVGIGQDMSRTTTAALDPIFYCHHANVDRLWAMWNEDPDPGRGQNPVTDLNWMDHDYPNHFRTRAGAVAQVENRNLVTTRRVAPNLNLNYRYDTQEEVLSPGDLQQFEAQVYYVDTVMEVHEAYAISRANTGEVVDRNIPIPNSTFFQRMQVASTTLPDQQQFRFIKLIIEDIHPPETGDIIVRVFINCDYLTADVPPSDPHYVTTFSFFRGDGGMQHMHPEAHNFLIDLTETLRKLRGSASFPDENTGFSVQLVALPANNDDAVYQYRPGNVKVGFVVARGFNQ